MIVIVLCVAVAIVRVLVVVVVVCVVVCVVVVCVVVGNVDVVVDVIMYAGCIAYYDVVDDDDAVVTIVGVGNDCYVADVRC